MFAVIANYSREVSPLAGYRFGTGVCSNPAQEISTEGAELDVRSKPVATSFSTGGGSCSDGHSNNNKFY